jgi:hypothetical protein
MGFKRASETAAPDAVVSITIVDVEKGKFEVSKAAMDQIGLYGSAMNNTTNNDRVDVITDEDTNEVYIARVEAGQGSAISRNGKVTHKSLSHAMFRLGGTHFLLADAEPISWAGQTWYKVALNTEITEEPVTEEATVEETSTEELQVQDTEANDVSNYSAESAF